MEGFVEENEPPLPPWLQQEEPAERNKFEKDDVALVFCRETDSVWNSVVYIRKHLMIKQQELDGFFQHGRINQMYIQGPPGCGKTCFCLLWARLLSVRDGKRVLIVQFRAQQSCFIWIREPGGTLRRMIDPIDSPDLRTSVKELLKKSKEDKEPFDLCVHDGVLNIEWSDQESPSRHLACLFALYWWAKYGFQWHYFANEIQFLDYQEALKCEQFREELTKSDANCFINDDKEFLTESDDNGGGGGGNVTMDESTMMKILEHKYFYAGGSARFMFSYSIQHVKEELNGHLENMKEQDWAYFATTNIGSGTSSSVNILMQRFDRKCIPVSKYVLFYAYDKCKTPLVDSVTAAANEVDNPSLKGWAFELEQLDVIRLSLESVKKGQNPSLVTNQNGLSFCPGSAVDFDGETIQFTKEKTTIAKNENYSTVIWCQKWNQGCFDTAFVQDSTLVTLQFTVSEKHSFKPNFIRKLRDALGEKNFTVNKFVHVGVTEVDQNDFQFIVDLAGTGQPDGTNTNVPEFTIELHHSPPLEREVVGINFDVQTSFTTEPKTVNIFQLAKKRKREEGVDVITVNQTIVR